jgi:hypothetical protein
VSPHPLSQYALITRSLVRHSLSSVLCFLSIIASITTLKIRQEQQSIHRKHNKPQYSTSSISTITFQTHKQPCEFPHNLTISLSQNATNHHKLASIHQNALIRSHDQCDEDPEEQPEERSEEEER